MNLFRTMLFAFIPIVLLAQSGFCGTITGLIRDAETGRPIRMQVHAYEAGRSIGITQTSNTEGRFVMEDLSPGTYAVCVGVGERHRPQVTSVTVPEDGEAEVRFSLSPSIEVEGDSWVQGYPVFHQSFTATGLGVTSLRLKGFGPGRAVTVQMLEGDGTTGRQIGPSRTTVRFGHEGETAVFWSGGELPTAPGQAYTFRMSAEDGETWIPGMAGRGNVYPLGRAYFGNEARPHTDLGFAICEENDNLATSYAVSAGQRAKLVRSVGQTFIARGQNILYASASLNHATAGRAVYVRFSIHEEGPGGRQIGPSKATSVGEPTVAWLPGEVNVTPGQKYYLHIESYDGASFYAFQELDPYAHGEAYTNAEKDADYDLAAWIAGELSKSGRHELFSHPRSRSVVNLVNPSFEEGMRGWFRTERIGRIVGNDGGVIPAWGSHMFGWTNKGRGEGSRTVIYQTVNVTKGNRYSFSGSVYTDRIGGRSSDQKIRLVVNPQGNPEFTNETMQSSQWYATEGQWRRGSMEFVAESDRVVIGFEMEQRWSLDMCSLYIDGAHLDEIGGR